MDERRAGFERHAREQRERWLALTPHERLSWLERAKQFERLAREGRVDARPTSVPTFADRLRELLGTTCASVEAVTYDEPPSDTVFSVGTVIHFASGARLRAQFWRLSKAESKGAFARVSIFDHGRKYGLPAPVDAIAILREELEGRPVVDASMNAVNGDLALRFDPELTLEVFNFTAFEIWELTFADGANAWSNYFHTY